MSAKTKEQVLELLKNFTENQRKIALLRYEMEHPAHISTEDMINTLTFGHGDSLGNASGHVSNKTMYIALNYQEKADCANSDILDEIAVQLCELERQQERLQHYIGLLEKREADIIRMTYAEKMSNEAISKNLGISVRTIRLVRGRAIDSLCKMYCYTDGFHKP